MNKIIELGFCECGCGLRTRIAPVNDRSKGWKKGEPLRFIKGHGFRIHKRGEKAPRWKGGRSISSHGYVVLSTADGRRYEHIVVAEAAIGRPLRNLGKGHPLPEVVHHVDGNKTNNSPSNLLVCTHAYHTELHHRLESSQDWPEFPKIVRNEGKRNAASF